MIQNLKKIGWNWNEDVSYIGPKAGTLTLVRTRFIGIENLEILIKMSQLVPDVPDGMSQAYSLESST